jgi:hypothetical protein
LRNTEIEHRSISLAIIFAETARPQSTARTDQKIRQDPAGLDAPLFFIECAECCHFCAELIPGAQFGYFVQLKCAICTPPEQGKNSGCFNSCQNDICDHCLKHCLQCQRRDHSFVSPSLAISRRLFGHPSNFSGLFSPLLPLAAFAGLLLPTKNGYSQLPSFTYCSAIFNLLDRDMLPGIAALANCRRSSQWHYVQVSSMGSSSA